MLTKEEFVAILKNHLLAFIPGHPDRERIMIKLLSKLFSDIDLNDNGTLEWNEFTNYIIHNTYIFHCLSGMYFEGNSENSKSDVEIRTNFTNQHA